MFPLVSGGSIGKASGMRRTRCDVDALSESRDLDREGRLDLCVVGLDLGADG